MSHVMQYQPQWIREDFVDFIAEKINPVWAWKKVKASIVDVHMLSSDFYQIELQPNHNFRADAFRAGQSILVTVVIAGVREQRSYSIVKIAANGHVVIAVKRQGKVSNALTRLTAGSVVARHGVVFPALNGMAEQVVAQHKLNGVDASAFLTMAKEQTFLSPVADNGAQVSELMKNAIENVLLGRKAAGPALQDANDKINRLFKPAPH